MKQRLLISGIFLLLFSMVQGQSYFSPLIGDLPATTEVRQVSLGFSGWGSSGSASALFFNPAQIGLTGSKMTVYGGFTGAFVKEKRSFPVQDSFGDFLADNYYIVNSNSFPGFQAGINYRLIPKLTFALAYQYATERDFRYEEEVRGSVFGQYNRDPLVGFHRISSTGTTSNLAFGAACRLFKPIWLGASMQIVLPGDFQDKYEIQVIHESVNLASEQTISYQSEPQIDPGVIANLGLTVDLTKHLTIATSYKFSNKSVQKDGLIHLINDSTAMLPVLGVDSIFAVEKVTFNNPAEWRIGLSLKPVNIIPTELFLEFVYQAWSNYSTEYEFKPDVDLSEIPTDFYITSFKLKDIWKIHVGVEHRFFSGVPFRIGFYFDPSPIDPGMDRNWFTAGTGYHWNKLTLEVAGAFTNSEYQYPDLFPITGEERIENDTVRNGYLVGMLTLKYSF
ncbi:MAG: outer membrane protein transport protein [Candidatus Marinimicrobia bacterium]|nr:outer membrane protein transport protein [Candidatus Neomarinimicrobiota bacterium]